MVQSNVRISYKQKALNAISAATLIGLVISLSACGDGGSSGGVASMPTPTPPPPPPPPTGMNFSEAATVAGGAKPVFSVVASLDGTELPYALQVIKGRCQKDSVWGLPQSRMRSPVPQISQTSAPSRLTAAATTKVAV
jgi:hypothetical protein